MSHTEYVFLCARTDVCIRALAEVKCCDRLLLIVFCLSLFPLVEIPQTVRVHICVQMFVSAAVDLCGPAFV